ncbi:MAG: hypothetical protein A3I77_07630 [Gammaproteobacteria bacterium RIFCSPLOWO2_02_FULL_42_14]|nr:MAG: hypothetical protein A3B71_03460 [Gammaproteobacteria bacterium RIFCSPHIGHO2_02_FULL_42_43]OGT53012.1 MAG: hypothetical protein A3E54_08065 [Gammaproteobacteria bacterium RIFCSPHIGHO2_12_FULL_41_25]OGT61216.1 MAG: hypothetical protein A3I77_07630 [Gammaproteobacteria bacterium RIFCSPLOWO2_02_FULL_42_14]OGT87143.1 MAG: hypothetical protein A3G86_01350 [Gammaproteobacteria bacterium RIFCSPLOWO2_12_FULL_42_18]
MNRFFLAVLLFYCTSSLAQLSNMIVFGDSLSDVGNFPESSRVWWDPQGKKDLHNIVPQLYVPFSNPVSTQTDNPYLAKQAPIENNKNPRKYRSISWPQYFLIDAKNKKLLPSDYIAPSNLLNTQKIPNAISFNYAWGYATSEKNCVNPHYQLIKNCDSKSIYDARKNYEENPSHQNYLKLEIPGLFQQLQLFTQDYHANKISVDKNTVYAFWIGGNDLIIAANELRKRGNPFPALKFIFGGVEKNELKNISILIQQLPVNQRPKNIYALELFNPGLTPGFYHTKIASIANFFVKCANFWLRWDTKLFNLFSNTKIVIMPVYQWYENDSENTLFQAHMGQACQLNFKDYTNPTIIPKTNCMGFMFWNAVHPASGMNKRVAELFLNQIIDKKSHFSKTSGTLC